MAPRPESTPAARHRPARHGAGERGVVMFVALVVLIVMTLAGLAMLRQMSSGSSIAGNIAFKQGATAVADAGIEAGRAWLGANSALLEADQPANGYYATWAASVDPTSPGWTALWNAAPVLAPAVTGNTGNTVRYVIERLCNLPGPVTGGAQQCSDAIPTSGGGGSKGGGSYDCTGCISVPASPYYRVTAQVTGPRNTVSYTQVVMN